MLDTLERIRAPRGFFFDPTCVLYMPNKEFGRSAVDGKYYAMSSDHYGHLIQNNGSLWRPDSHRFDGDDWWNIDKVLPSLASTTTGTWMTWIKLDDAYSGGFRTMIAFGDTNANEIIYMFHYTRKILARLIKAGTTQWYLTTDNVVLANGIYTNIALTQNGVSPVILVNGEVVAQTFTASMDKTTWFSVCTGLDNGLIGCSNYNSTGRQYFVTNGNLALTKIFNRNLSIPEVQRIYESEKWRYR